MSPLINKLSNLHNLGKVTDFFTSLNLPMPAQMAVFISCVEFFGGLFLAIGLFSRMTALVLTINMIMAYVTADREALFSIISDPDKFYAAAPYVFLIASLIILIFGPGKFCVDYLLGDLLTFPPPQPPRLATSSGIILFIQARKEFRDRHRMRELILFASVFFFFSTVVRSPAASRLY